MAFLSAVENSSFAIWVRESGSLWSYPTIIFLHSLGLSFLAGMNAAVDLRLLGLAPRVPLAPMEKIFPIMWLGFWVSGASGVALLAASAKLVAATSLLLWIGVMYWGRMLPFLGDAF